MEFLKSKAPEVFSEGKIDCKKLKNTIGDAAEDGEERYGINWAGKNDCFRNIQEQTTATLKPNREESINFDKTGNLFIEGDNLDVLRVLQRSYYSKVKMIYIDPPYNTGNDFIYNDKFAQSRDEYLEKIGEKDGNGNTLRIDGMSKNSKDGGHYHSTWLNMMYPRLFLARNLLRQDGVIFVSIDDNEVHNLRMIMNEIFGEENFEGMISWRRRTNQPNDETKMIAKVSEYILVFSKNSETLKELKTFNKISISENRLASYSNPDNDKRGDWSSTPWCASKGQGGSEYEIKTPTGRIYKETWLGTKETFEKLLKESRIIFPNNGDGKPRKKIFKKERLEQGQPAIDFWFDKRFGDNLSANSEIKELIGKERLFDYPKPTNLIKTMLEIATQKNDIILDFFSGSGTTAQAVMEQNTKDGGNRKWICVQLPELCDENSEAYKAGYKTIADIAKERIKRASKKIKGDFDSGFKFFKLDNSNFKIWRGKFENAKKLLDNMKDFVDNVKSGSTQDNLLYEIIIKSGLDLNVKIEEKGSGDDKYYSVDDGKLIIYLGNKISKESAEEFQKAKPEKIVCLDRCFNNNDQLKTNIMLRMEQEKIDFKVI